MVIDLPAPRAGRIAAFDTRQLGLAVVALGGGRLRSDQAIDPAVGFTDIVEQGAAVQTGEPLLRIHARNAESARVAAEMAGAAVTIAPSAGAEPALVWKRVTREGIA